ncbi:3-oxoacid CoA-transferase subunit B [Metabacillus sediminilitoris]|uniref:3-oxoacid CoA-transferase subunit B n=1 Tax=Metabacillus sediminilitoris TaxID=2567941 RepID=A0A4S4C0K6_9BACI|nr:3-oxoacid CoA-transferase subunit B [Metabacillus sediminilitoris]THF81149.1 3-oxoacid CoA-transferase subunit B [Metabacillus sediminilitoris]
MVKPKELIAMRAAKELKDGNIVNLGIGIPTLVSKYIESKHVFLHTENGLLGVDDLKTKDDIDPLIVNAGKLPIGEAIGASYFSSADSFAMIRGGHIDVAILGALQVDENGYIANWAIPGENIMGVGGAMDLMSGAKKIIVTTNHTNKKGESKLVKSCSYPITSIRKVDVIITDLAVFEMKNNTLTLIELMPGIQLEEVRSKTESNFVIAESLKEVILDEK